jgi:HlyD family secretion protein
MQKEVESVEEMINQMKLISPVNGFVEKRISLVGEVVGSGMPVINIVDNSSFYLKVYIDELKNGKVKLNKKASIFLDNELESAIDAKVVYISNKAEFTPKDVAVREDRITRVYEVWLKPIEANEYLKLGLPAIGMILIDDTKELPKTLKDLPIL